MPLYLKVNGRLIKTDQYYDSLDDLRNSKDYSETIFNISVEKGKLIVEFAGAEKRKEIRTPNGNVWW